MILEVSTLFSESYLQSELLQLATEKIAEAILFICYAMSWISCLQLIAIKVAEDVILYPLHQYRFELGFVDSIRGCLSEAPGA